ncbi:response regulator [Sneathiella sp. P13V-1]|uniref:ATP-binding protein n=1 Tax=Sneathiella sp. P13V-1 TaxID=2697366 RepID=UPI00187B2816|nr:ATP-binding protein [Sneathiella sp. P13V-1]MBE7636158.1 response regulator [Sneathiella sp. P13V-1]
MALLYFVYGLSFFTLGLVLFVRDMPSNLVRMNVTLRYLGVFGLLHGFNEWQIMLRINGGFDAWEILYSPALTSLVSGVSFLFLLLSGLSGYWLTRIFGDRPLKWVWFVIAVTWLLMYVAALSGTLEFRYVDFAARWLAGGPGAFFVAVSFYTMGITKLKIIPKERKEDEDEVIRIKFPERLSRVFIIASVAICSYGIFTLIGPKLPVLPFSHFNQEMFYELFGFPVQGLRTVSAFVLAITMFLCFRRFQIVDQRNMEAMVTQRTRQLLKSETLLRHAQKMEAVGQLTGGVSHDFNNILGVIQGNAELLSESEEIKSDRTRNMLDAIVKASARGADLTQNLLAFSRKQELSPESVRIDEQVRGTIHILQRTLGENIDLTVATDEDLWNCIVDPGQLDNALLNLAINARDAMKDGGKLTIEIRNAVLDDEYAAAQTELDPGEYVVIAVSDTGSGIGKGDLQRVFEPFFTTKEVGKGTGLGLSMIYGFAKQSGGHVNIYSEAGSGTTVRLYLPRSMENAPSSEVEKGIAVTGDEIILIVEDDPDMRTLTVALVSSLGYQVREAKDANAALISLDKEGPVNLLLTDVILPGGLNGPQLADIVAEKFPYISTLFMSGYTEQAFIGSNLADRHSMLLQKPFSRSDLSSKIRMALQ